MVSRYGRKLAEEIPGCPQITTGEIAYLIAEEDILHLDDLLLRRTLLGKLGRLNPRNLEAIAAAAAVDLGWSDAEKENEIERTRSIFLKNHKVKLFS